MSFVFWLGFAKSHHRIPPEQKKWVWPSVRGAPKILGSSFNIPATAEASDFKFGTKLGFVKAHHKIAPRGKSGCGLGLRALPKILQLEGFGERRTWPPNNIDAF